MLAVVPTGAKRSGGTFSPSAMVKLEERRSLDCSGLRPLSLGTTE